MNNLLLILICAFIFISCDDKEYLPHEIQISTIGDGDVNGSGTYGFGKNCIISAWANDGNGFLGWFEDGKLINKEEVYSFDVYKDRNLTAVFADTICSVRIYDIRSGNGSEVIVERLNVRKGKFYNFKAVPSGSESFTGWYDESMNKISKDFDIQIKIEKNRKLYRRFQR